MVNIDNAQDIIDSRDIIERLEELRSMREDYDESMNDYNEDPENNEKPDPMDDDDIEELRILEELEEEASASPDWQYGEALIRDSYFTEYAQDMAEDIGAISRDLQWPLYHIDWDAAAESLKQDYFSVNYDGVEYWIRG